MDSTGRSHRPYSHGAFDMSRLSCGGPQVGLQEKLRSLTSFQEPGFQCEVFQCTDYRDYRPSFLRWWQDTLQASQANALEELQDEGHTARVVTALNLTSPFYLTLACARIQVCKVWVEDRDAA